MGNVVKLARNKQNGEYPQSAPEALQRATEDFIYLLGRPTMKGYLSFAKSDILDEEMMDPKKLRDEWRAANAYIQELERTEAGIADSAVIKKLPRNLRPLLAKLEADPIFQKAFNKLPTQVAMVPLEQLVVYQKHINLTFAHQLKSRLPARPSAEEVFRMALPYDHPQPPAQWARTHGNEYVFMSPSNDMRYLGSIMLKPSEVSRKQLHGSIVGIVGLMVGFGSNFLNVIHNKKRLVLSNGSHRAYVLRDLGITHAPAIIQEIESDEDLRLVDSSALRNNPELYFENPRPPMLKDYFNPQLRKLLTVPRQLRQIRIEFETQEVFVPSV